MSRFVCFSNLQIRVAAPAEHGFPSQLRPCLPALQNDVDAQMLCLCGSKVTVV